MIVSVAAILSICYIFVYCYDESIQSELNEEEKEIFNVIYDTFCIGKFGIEPNREEYIQERTA